MIATTIRTALACVTLTAPTLLAGEVLTVGQGGSADYAEIQDAVDAAVDEDVILVRTGTYAHVQVVGKGLTILGRPGNFVTVAGGVEISFTGLDQEVLLAGMTLEGAADSGSGQAEALLFLSAEGTLRIQSCEVRGSQGTDFGNFDWGGDAARIESCPDVSFVRCTLQGGDGGYSFGGFQFSRGGDGVRAKKSSVAVHECQVQGGTGGPGDTDWDSISGYAGNGIHLVKSTGLVHGSQVEGGDGGEQRGDLVCQPGGHGVWVSDGQSHAQLLDNTLVGGESGCTPNGTRGEELKVEAGGTVDVLAGTARGFEAPTPVVSGTPYVLKFTGLAGDRVFLFSSAYSGDWQLLPGKNGGLLVQGPFAVRSVGTVPASGTLTREPVAPTAPAGEESLVFFTQTMFLDPSGGIWLASPSTLVVLQ